MLKKHWAGRGPGGPLEYPEKETAAGKGQEAGEPLAIGVAFGLLLGLLLENLLLGFVVGTAVGAAAGMVRKKR